MKTFIIILFILFQNELRADWTQTNGIYGGAVSKVFATGGKVFAVADYGTMYLSYDGGQSFILRTSGIKGVYVSSFVSFNNTVFAASGDSGIYKTTNDGLIWQKTNTGLGTLHVSSIIANGNILFAGTSSGFYSSSDNGATWIQPNSSFTLSISAMTITNNIIFAAASSSYSMIYSSSDNGLSWDTSMYDKNNYIILNTIESKDSEIYTSGFIAGLYRSTNSGLNWTFINSPPAFIYSLKIIDNKILAATGSGLYSSSDKGMTWSHDSNGVPSYLECRSLTVDGNNIYLSIGQGRFPACIYKSPNQGFSWEESSSNIIGTRINLLYKINNRIYTSAGYYGLFYTTDHGDSWINANTDLSVNAQTNIESMGDCQSNYLLLSGRNYISSNYGQNWQVFGSSSNPHFYEFITRNDTMLALKEYPWKSTDCGITWTAYRNGYDPGNYGFALRYTGEFTYSIAGTSISTSSLFRSSDFGNNWVRTLYTTTGYRLYSLAATGNQVVLGYTASDTGIIVSTDYGETFNAANSGLTTRKVNTLFVSSDKIFAGTANGIFYKPLNQNIWYPNNNSSFNLNVNCFISDSLYIYAGTRGNGIWRRPLNEVITASNESETLAEDFELSQNFPNPFNPVTQINFNLKKSSIINLTVFDVSGKKILTLLNKYTNEGNHSIIFDGSNLPSGIYFCKMTSGNFLDIIKMILAK